MSCLNPQNIAGTDAAEAKTFVLTGLCSLAALPEIAARSVGCSFTPESSGPGITYCNPNPSRGCPITAKPKVQEQLWAAGQLARR